MTSLSGSSGLAVLHHTVVISLLYLRDHLKLVRVVDYELFGLRTLVRQTCVRRNDLGLTRYRWNLIAILLYGGQVSGLPRNKMVLRLILTQDLGKLFRDIADRLRLCVRFAFLERAATQRLSFQAFFITPGQPLEHFQLRKRRDHELRRLATVPIFLDLGNPMSPLGSRRFSLRDSTRKFDTLLLEL